MTVTLSRYLDRLRDAAGSTAATGPAAAAMAVDDAIAWAIATARAAHAAGNKIIFIGNGGSAGIASHMATDFSKNGGLRAIAMNDAAMLTCLGNDYGYEHVFAKQIEMQARAGDLLVAISSSGRSPNILAAAAAARAAGCRVLTLTGFDPANPLRAMGDVNLHVPSHHYNFVETSHMALLAAIVDMATGWGTA
ncbi:MAG: hypothetical protein OHK0024_04450 [Thalassobaculales bacterium]